jgi:hypothetical protein
MLGYPRAEYKLGNDYFFGQGGVNQNYAKGVYWWKLATKQGYTCAESNLGYAYLHGLGVSQNYIKGIYWKTLSLADGGTGGC